MRRPSDRRSYIAQPTERSPRRHSRRRHSRDSRNRRDHRRSSPKIEHYESQPVDMQLGYGSDDEEVDRVHYRSRNSHSDLKRKAVDRSDAKLPNDQVREGIVFEYLNYYEFLRNWLDECNRILLRKNKSAIPKRINETITPTTATERARIILPAGVFERNDLLHCDIVIGGLPPSVFFGSGFGHKPSLARAAAAKDLVDKCLRVGLISDVLHTSIGNHPFFKKRELPRKDYDLAIDALLDLDKKISSGNWPWDLNTARELEPDTLRRLKEVFDSVMQDIYFPRPREWARSEFAHPPMPSNGIPTSSFAENRERAEFCRRCRIRGHSERYCLEGRGRSRERGLPTPEPNHDYRMINHGERLPSNMIDDRYVVNKNSLHYSQDEIEEKIARQREELLRQEMMLRRSEAVGNWTSNGVELQPLLPQPHSSMPQPLLPLCGDVGLRGSVHSLMNAASASSLLLEQQLRASRDEDLQAKLEAQKVEEEKRLRQMEEELERRMQRELEEKKRIMEEEIRKQVQLEERARLQMELARTQQQTLPSFSALAPNRFTSSYTQPSFSSGLASSVMPESSGAIGVAYASAPDSEMEEIKLLIKEIEDKLLELQRDCRETELSAIFQSRAFRMIGELGDDAHMLDRSQKQMLLFELKELLSQAGLKAKENKVTDRRRSRSRSRDRVLRRKSGRDRHERRVSCRRSRSRSPRIRNSYKHGLSTEDPFKEVRVQVGGLTLRNLSPSEQRRLKVGEIVVAQDVKTGKWTTSRLAKVSGNRATLSIGNTTWKKDLNELYKEVLDRSF